jgi:hypothetical protein
VLCGEPEIGVSDSAAEARGGRRGAGERKTRVWVRRREAAFKGRLREEAWCAAPRRHSVGFLASVGRYWALQGLGPSVLLGSFFYFSIIILLLYNKKKRL